jgi:hypothetical protein
MVPAISLTSVLDCTPAVLAMLVYLGAGLGYALSAALAPADSQGPCCSALADYLATHDLPPRLEAALRRGAVVPGLTARQVSLLRGAPRTVTQAGARSVWVYDGPAQDVPAWTYVAFEDGRVSAVEHVRTTELARDGGVKTPPPSIAPE